jgi:hypothetical protein
VDGGIGDAGPLGDVMLHEIVLDDLETEPFGQPGSHLLPACAYLPGERNNGHDGPPTRFFARGWPPVFPDSQPSALASSSSGQLYSYCMLRHYAAQEKREA